MPRPRTPIAVARLTGQDKVHPERFRNRADPTSGPIGEPPERLSEAQANAWRDFVSMWPWLVMSDRAALELLCHVRARVENADVTTAALLSEYRLQLSSFGGTPTSRSRIVVPELDDEDDPFMKFLD